MKPKKKRVSNVMLVLGCCCILVAAAFGIYNYVDSQRADAASQELTSKLTYLVTTGKLTQQEEEELPTGDDPQLGEEEAPVEEMAAVYVSGYKICGVLSMPDINIELAIIGEWSYPNLKIAPCRYSGTPNGQMILLAHNYNRHFGKINTLEPGDQVAFTDIDGNVYNYEVTGTEIWATNQLREIISGDEWDLTLFTCTYGGNERIVVRCVRV